ncbi:hypothetical protein OsI_19489 [Oryza sativa Indica Group]|uniref:Uncharacterized protein n=1 Tax=Oryza sativa subsp. indica TaxID=39946 RepID=B8AWN4_ORYSI|nr:hypothetical protein OsI_19489 [Oryza sativa Indica Group]
MRERVVARGRGRRGAGKEVVATAPGRDWRWLTTVEVRERVRRGGDPLMPGLGSGAGKGQQGLSGLAARGRGRQGTGPVPTSLGLRVVVPLYFEIEGIINCVGADWLESTTLT